MPYKSEVRDLCESKSGPSTFVGLLRARLRAVLQLTSWKMLERRFGIRLHDGLKDLQRKITGPPGAKISSKDIDQLYANIGKKPEITVEVVVRQKDFRSVYLRFL